MKKSILRLVILFVLIFLWASQSFIYAGIPRLINYQGRLANHSGQSVADGAYSVTFRIFDSENAGNLLWEEVQSVVVRNGVFSALLGGITPLDINFDIPYWLEIKVGNEVMVPRQRIASSGYAIRSEKAETADKALTIENRTSDPSSPLTGQIWLRTDL